MNIKITANHLSFAYKQSAILKDLSFQLEDGKIYGLLGRNGAGKTTLLSLLASFMPSSAGSLKIDGEEAFENAAVMRQVGLIYETDYTEETSTVEAMLEDVAFTRPNYDAEYATHLIQRFKLPLDQPVNKLSRGMKAALSVTLGLSSRCPVTLFDEAYQGMDAPTREIFYEEVLEDQANHPRIFILSTHYVSEMDYLFDEVLILDKGELLYHEDYETLTSKGFTVTGETSVVEEWSQGLTVLNEQQLGPTKSLMVYGTLSPSKKQTAAQNNLTLSPINLQDLFIHLTKEDE